MNELKIAKELSLPIDAVTRRIAFIGTIGAGKTYGAGKLIEEMYRVKAQIVILDPVGIHWALRLARDGKSPGLTIPVFGGLHGDIPLEPTAGKLVADLIVDRGISLVMDISQFEYDTEKVKFTTDFVNRFFFRKKSKPSAVHIFLEEAQEFCPQNIAKGEEKMLHAFVRMWKIGRNFGIGGSIISQRPQEINKKVLNLSECVFAFRTTGTHERKAIDDWMKDKGLDLDLANDLPKLKVGQPHLWSPGWLGQSMTVNINLKKTFDASATPVVGQRTDVKELAKIDLQKLSKAMEATIERAKQSDPDLLKKEIRLLKLELAKKGEQTVKFVDNSEYQNIIQELKKENQNYKIALKSSETLIKKQIDLMVRASEILGKKIEVPKINFYEAIEKQNIKDQIKPIPEKKHYPITTPYKSVVNPTYFSDEDIKIRAGARRMLAALVQWSPNGMTEGQMRSQAGLKKSGTYSAYKTELKQSGLMTINSDGLFYATDEGINWLGHDIPSPKTTSEVLDVWNPKLRLGARRMLNVLISHKGEFISDEQLQEESELANSGTFSAYKTELKTAQLAIVERGRIAANKETLFL